MASTATALRTLLKANLHNDTTFSDPGDLNTFLTLGQRRIVSDSPHTLGMKSSSVTTLADSSTREYSLASDFYQMVQIWNQTFNIDLEYIPVGEFVDVVERQPSIPVGPALGYTVLGWSDSSSAWRIRFDYAPDQVYTINYWYYWMPSDISGSTTPSVSAIGFDELLVWAATMIARERNDPDGAELARQRYEKLLEDYRGYKSFGPNYYPIVNPFRGRQWRNRYPLGPHFPPY